MERGRSCFAKTLTGQTRRLRRRSRQTPRPSCCRSTSLAPQGKLDSSPDAHCQARATRSRSGRLGGYSTIWLARASPDDGRLITSNCPNPGRTPTLLCRNLARAGLGDKVEIRTGPALETLLGDSRGSSARSTSSSSTRPRRITRPISNRAPPPFPAGNDDRGGQCRCARARSTRRAAATDAVGVRAACLT